MSPESSSKKSKTRQRQRSKSPAPDSPASNNKEGVKVSPRSGTAFPGYNFHPVLRIYSNAPVASSSMSTASATVNTFEHQPQSHPSPQARGSPKPKKSAAANLDVRPRRTSTESLRRHIATQQSPTTSEGSRTTARSSSSPRMFMRSSSSSSSSSLSSLAGTDTPSYIQGLGLNLKAAVPLPPAVDNGVGFPSMEKGSSIPTDLSPAHSNESLKSCIKEAARSANGGSHSETAESAQIPEESPTTRKRRSVSFAVEDPVVHRLRSSSSPSLTNSETNTNLGDYIASANEDSQEAEEQSPIPFPSFSAPVTRPRSLSSILPERFIGMDMAGSIYTYIRSNTLSSFSSRTSLSSDDWDARSEDDTRIHRDAGWIRTFVETALGLTLAVGWLAVGRVVGTDEPRRARTPIELERTEDDDTHRNRIEM